MKTFSLITPVYFNAEALPHYFAALTEFERELEVRGVGLESIFVNDGSRDASQVELMKIKAQRPGTKIIRHTKNFGATAASKTGFKFVSGDAFLVHSADLQDPFGQVLAMVDEWLRGERFVISVRAGRKDPWVTRVFAALYYQLVHTLAVSDYPAEGFDLMLCAREILPYLLDSDRHVNINIYTYSLGFAPKVLSYTRGAREYGRSRWTFRKKLNHAANTITGFTATPIRLFSLFGFVVASLSFIYGAHMVLAALRGEVDGHGFATIVVLISFFSGMILLMLGVLGEYLYRTFERTGRRPESVVGETFL